MDETTLMEKKLENEPNHEKRTTDKPHLRETFPVNLGLSQNRLCKRAAVPQATELRLVCSRRRGR
jgi:hypothetical protein